MQNRMFHISAIFCMYLAIIGCATDNYSSRSSIDADREAVVEVIELLLNSLMEGDTETYFTLYEKDAVWLGPSTRMGLSCEKAPQALHRALLVYDFGCIVPRMEEVVTDRNLAYAIASYSGLRPYDVHHVQINTRHIYVLRRQDDGEWKIARTMWVATGGEQFTPPSE